MPSRPMLSTPAASEIVSPSAVNISGTPARSTPETNVVRTGWSKIWLASSSDHHRLSCGSLRRGLPGTTPRRIALPTEVLRGAMNSSIRPTRRSMKSYGSGPAAWRTRRRSRARRRRRRRVQLRARSGARGRQAALPRSRSRVPVGARSPRCRGSRRPRRRPTKAPLSRKARSSGARRGGRGASPRAG